MVARKMALTQFKNCGDLQICLSGPPRARVTGCSMAALLATERHLWLNLSEIKDKDRSFFVDATLSPPGLFGNAVNTVIERFQEAKKQAEAFKRYFPRCRQPSGTAGRDQPSSSSYRAQQKESVAFRAPPQKSWWPGQHSQPRSSKQKPDLRAVLLAEEASGQKRS